MDQTLGRPFDCYRLPKSKAKREQLAVQIGQDGFYLLEAIYAETGPEELKKSAKVETLRRIWVQQFYYCEDEVFWRTKRKWAQPPAGKMIASPEDQEARYCVKRSNEWTEYKVHLTETCDPDQPRIITQVTTTSSTTHDVKVTQQIQQELVSKDLRPKTHLVDEGYMEIDLLVESQKRGIDLVGPVPSSKSWQDREEGAFNHSQFEIDWERMIVTCPNNKTNIRWSERKTWRGTRNLLFVFD